MKTTGSAGATRLHTCRLTFCIAAVFLYLFFNSATCRAQQGNLLRRIIYSDSFAVKYAKVLHNPLKYHLQVIYTRINRDSGNRPHLKSYYLCPPSKRYYYPASLVKLPLVALALEKLDSLNIAGLTADTRLVVDSSHACQCVEYRDTTAKDGYPSIAQYIKKMLLVSDNRSYNRIYEFLSPAYINGRLGELGYNQAEINQRFGGGCDTTDNRFTNSFTFLSADSSAVIYRQAAGCDTLPFANCAACTKIGRGYMDKGRVLPPRDFRYCNYIPFESMNRILMSIIFPQCFPKSSRFGLKPEDYRFLYKYMSMLPRESEHPGYSQKEFPDNFKKYNYFGCTDTITDTAIRSFNIVGRAYGFISDCSYIADLNTGTEFFLSVLLYTNEKDILNTSNYEYKKLALPFMSDLGHLIYNYERKRRKRYHPDLSLFRFRYKE